MKCKNCGKESHMELVCPKCESGFEWERKESGSHGNFNKNEVKKNGKN